MLLESSALCRWLLSRVRCEDVNLDLTNETYRIIHTYVHNVHIIYLVWATGVKIWSSSDWSDWLVILFRCLIVYLRKHTSELMNTMIIGIFGGGLRSRGRLCGARIRCRLRLITDRQTDRRRRRRRSGRKKRTRLHFVAKREKSTER